MAGNRLNRREFIKTASKIAAGSVVFPYFVPSSAIGKAGSVAAGSRIVMGCIGVGGKGYENMSAFLVEKDVQMAAICDVNQKHLQNAVERVNRQYDNNSCAAYNNCEELLARKDIDAVSIASPDHWHVLHSLQAARAGKDMYTEKPLGMSIEEDKSLRRAVHSSGVVFQFGTQQRSMQNFRFAVELVRNGRIGKLTKVEVGSPASRVTPNFPPMPVPEWLDYDKWLGPAPWKPYTENRIINNYWWHISDYALGFVAGWGVHFTDIAQWGLDADTTGPVQIEGTGTFPSDGLCDCATAWDVDMQYGSGVPVSYTSNGRNKMGVKFIGTQGWVYVNRPGIEYNPPELAGGIDAYPKSLLRERIGPDDEHLAPSNDHTRNFLDCVKDRKQPIAPIDAAVRSDTLCHLTDIAMRLDRRLRWDPVKEEFIDDDGANQMLKRTMRSPWHL